MTGSTAKITETTMTAICSNVSIGKMGTILALVQDDCGLWMNGMLTKGTSDQLTREAGKGRVCNEVEARRHELLICAGYSIQ